MVQVLSTETTYGSACTLYTFGAGDCNQLGHGRPMAEATFTKLPGTVSVTTNSVEVGTSEDVTDVISDGDLISINDATYTVDINGAYDSQTITLTSEYKGRSCRGLEAFRKEELTMDPTESRPRKVEGLTNIVSVAAGGLHTLCLTDTGNIYSFGYVV